ncbi:hypothetical protein L7F22_014737 [Adiantum nelumboides]|nr:hypothetical protein [Adiantum nelumboides]
MSFLTFNGAAGEDAQEFLDNLEIACLVTGRDDDATRLRVFSLLMKSKAKAWFNTLLLANRGDWAGLRVLFLAKFGGGGETSESLWGKVCELRQGSLFEYNVYELHYVELWERQRRRRVAFKLSPANTQQQHHKVMSPYYYYRIPWEIPREL